MDGINAIADKILDLCKIEDVTERECLRECIVKAISEERKRLNVTVQMHMAEFRLLVEKSLLPRNGDG